ncbi:hypothetical protein AU377_06490 [Sporosarcina sp. HYO08]|nr:hypothetical protein AU377_06490 [Sporosarcina sp. HYO08]
MNKVAATPNRNYVSVILPGLVICFLIMMLGIYLAELIGVVIVKLNILPEGSASPVSGIFVAILIGIIIRNALKLHPIFVEGAAFSVKYALRAGIILLGLRLSLIEAVRLGAWGIPLVVICISCGIFVTLFFTKKLNQSKRLGTLIACGTGICGVTAIMATSPVLKAKDNEISYAVANITVFGLVGMLFYPYLANLFFADDPIKAGLFLGTAIHDTAQVTGAALIFNQVFDMEQAVDVAMVTKLTRNLFIIAVIPLISFFFYKNASQEGGIGEERNIPKWYKFIPLFVIGFLLLALVRTIGDMNITNNGVAFGFLEPDAWKSFYSASSSFGTTYMLGLAMAGVGLSTDFSKFKGLGIKPFLIGLIAAVAVGAVSLTLVSLFGHLVAV